MVSKKKTAKAESKLKLVEKDFVHLHTHSHYSVLDGLQKIPDLLDRVKELGMSSVALTDHGTMSGVIEFYKGCIERELKPIIGIETYVANRKHTDKDPQVDRSRYHLTLLAMNNQGYKNLMRLSTIANLQGFYHKPRIDHELLETYGDGLIVLSGCIGGEVGEHLRNDDPKKAEAIANWYKKLFEDRYYIEIQDHDWDEQKRVNEKLITLAKKLDIPVVLTSDAHYCRKEDQEAHEILLCVQTGAFLNDPGRFTLKDTKLFVSDPKDIIERWQNILPEAISNTKVVADRCGVELELGKILIPKYEVPKGETAKSYLEKLAYQGLVERYCPNEKILDVLSIPQAKKKLSKEIVERAEFELGVMDKMNFNDYFLIFWDFVKWGKDHNIVFGPGRGSAAGSILSYALGITELDPLKYDLLFERFLNPDRISMPDIDIDIQHNRRDEVIQYVSEKYGAERVANIVTFGKMFARNAVRDVARVLQVPYADADRLAKLIPPPVQGRHIALSKSIKENVELKEVYESEPIAKQVIDLAVLLEGTIRSHGVHAAGVVVAPEEIVNYAPLEMAQKGVVATQYSMYPIMDDIGLLKMDFLGLSNLTIIKNALRIVKKVYGKEIDITKIPLDDKKTFELLANGETTGVFQLESAGMKRYLKELKPTVFDDIIAMVALYRPGPMQWIDDFISRKNGQKEIEYVHEAMKPSLESTYGVIVYQEQVMQISKDMCGFTGGQADTLRKAIGKKSPEILAKMKADFIEGGVKTVGASPEMMGIFWRQLEDFAAYCFNKSHAACYGLIAYQTAYLKAHYPAALMAALMTDDYDDTDRLTIDITECKHMGLEVLPPDVNQSFHEFGVIVDGKKTSIRFGLDAIKNVGRGAVEEILVARGDKPFTDLNNFAERVSVRTVNKKNWESLIKAGAMDCFGSRSALLNSLDSILLVANKRQKDIASAQADLFGETDSGGLSTMPKLVLKEPEVTNKQEFLIWERELLGLYLSDHPLKDYELILSEKAVPLKSITPGHDGKTAEVGGTITAMRQIITKNGQVMAFVKLEDMTGETELVVFPSVFKESNKDLWQRDNVILAKGRVSGADKNGATLSEAKILVESARVLSRDDALDYKPKGTSAEIKDSYKSQKKRSSPGYEEQAKVPKVEKLYVRIENTGEEKKLVALKRLLETKSGPTEVVLVMGPGLEKQAVRLPFKVTVDEETVREISELVGSGNVISQ